MHPRAPTDTVLTGRPHGICFYLHTVSVGAPVKMIQNITKNKKPAWREQVPASAAKLQFILEIIKRYDTYIGTTNVKSALLLSFLAAVIFGLFSQVANVLQRAPGLSILKIVALGVSALTFVISMITALILLRVIFPRTRGEKTDPSLLFFSDVAAHADGAPGYADNLRSASYSRLTSDAATQAYQLAKILHQKFRLLRIAVNLMTYVVLPLILLSLIVFIAYWSCHS